MFVDIILPALIFILVPTFFILLALIHESRRLKRFIKKYY